MFIRVAASQEYVNTYSTHRVEVRMEPQVVNWDGVSEGGVYIMRSGAGA